MYYINTNITNMYFRVNLKMKKPTLCCCFTWIVFIELNFTVGMADFPLWWGNWGILRNGGILVIGGVDDSERGRGVDTPLWTMRK